jgi:hypothetical protein
MKKIYLTVFAAFCFCAATHSQNGSLVKLYGPKLVDDSLGFVQRSASVTSRSGLVDVNIEELLQSGTPQKKVLHVTQKGRDVELYFFPGTSNKKALIVGGIHGSELSSIEIARALIRKLSAGEKPFYSVIIIPSLFPDNASTAEGGGQDRVMKNTGRYTSEGYPDPNRQMPYMGRPFEESRPLDVFNRTIEPENRALLELIQTLVPDRVLGIHAIRDQTKAGVFADPRTSCNGEALGFETDKQLAVIMAKYIQTAGGICPGNKLETQPTALYYLDPPIVPQGQRQPRSFQFPMIQGQNRGVTLGTWCSTAVCSSNAALNRPAIRTLTMEFPGYKIPAELPKKEDQEARTELIEMYAASVYYYFLSSFFVEEDRAEEK